MFWERFYELCIEKGSKPNPIASELGLSSAVLTKWKKGESYPNGEILIAIAKYFDCSIDYLVGLTDSRKSFEHKISVSDKLMLEKLHSLTQEDQDEIFYMLNYKYNKVKGKETEKSSLFTKQRNDLLA